MKKLIIFALASSLLFALYINTSQTVWTDGDLHESYNKNYSVSKQIERLIISGVLEDTPNISLQGPVANKVNINEAIKEISDHLTSIVESNNELVTYNSNIEILTAKSATENGTSMFYFLDDSTGTLEQLFIFRVANGNILKLSLIWEEGECTDVKTSYHV